MKDIEQYLEQNSQRFEEELKDFLRIASVSADSRFAGEIKRAAEFVHHQFASLGLETQTIPTAGHPLVKAAWHNRPGAPTILIYGHYDVQPPDPLDLWQSGPFEPTVRDGNLYARGATDDKGQMFTHVKAVEAWLKTRGELPLNVTFLIEGEEEVGGEAIEAYVAANADALRCDYVVISDTAQLAPDVPAVTYGLKGICYFEVIARGPKRDLHSGTFGGSVQNPANAICTLMAALRDREGRIQIPGFYDGVAEVSDAERAQIASLPFNDADYARELGVRELHGEKGYSTLERKWIRPTCDVNGIFGGYQGEGAKTVLPAWAGAKVSFRLVPKQHPRKIEAAFRAFLEERRPAGIELEVKMYHAAEAVVVPLDSAGMAAAARALEKGFGHKPVFIREGGSIPIVSTFKQHLAADSLLLGFGLPDDNTHSPNEKFALRDFHRGIKTSAHLLAELASLSGRARLVPSREGTG